MCEKSIKKQTSYRVKLKLVNRRETAGSNGQGLLACSSFFMKSHLYCAIASILFPISV